MKPIYILLFLSCWAFSTQSQINPEMKKLIDQVNKNMDSMFVNATLNKYDLSSCHPSDFYISMDKRDLLIYDVLVERFFKIPVIVANLPVLKEDYDKGFFANLSDKALEAVQKEKTASKFIEKFSGKALGNVLKVDQKILRAYFKRVKDYKIDREFIGENTFNHNSCTVRAKHFISLDKLKLGKVTWSYYTTIHVTCKCSEFDTKTSLKTASFSITGTSSGTFSTTKMTIGELKNARYSIYDHSCCGNPKNSKDEDANMQLDPNENISLPQQTIGGSVGVGFSNDFDETNVCLGAEYLFNVTDVGNSSLFVGANVFFENNSFNDFNNTIVGAGPTVQLFTPINPSKDVYMTNGISTDLLFGTNDNNGIKDDVFGFDVTLNTGLNVRINEDISLLVKVPIVTFTNLEFTSQDGDASIKSNSTDIFLFKNSPVKFGVRFDLVD